MLLFLPVVLLVFCGRAEFNRFRMVLPLSPALFLCVGLWQIIPQLFDSGCDFFPFVYVFSWWVVTGLFVLRFLAVWHPCQISSPGPLWTFECLPRMPHWPTPHIPTIHGHLCTSCLACVSVASVYVCVLAMFAYWCVCVCRRPWCKNVCVRGVMY